MRNVSRTGGTPGGGFNSFRPPSGQSSSPQGHQPSKPPLGTPSFADLVRGPNETRETQRVPGLNELTIRELILYAKLVETEGRKDGVPSGTEGFSILIPERFRTGDPIGDIVRERVARRALQSMDGTASTAQLSLGDYLAKSDPHQVKQEWENAVRLASSEHQARMAALRAT